MKITYQNQNKIELEEMNTKGFYPISQMYSFTTENIAGYFPYLDFTNKNVLTVAASGDHIINAFYQGAKKVIAFDINKLALLFTELKLVALEQLSYEEFLEFFMIEEKEKEKNKKALDYVIYQTRLRSQLLPDTAKNWDTIYKNFGNNGYELRNSNLFNNKYDNNKIKISSNLYLKSKFEYQKAKESIKQKQIQLLNCNYQDIGNSHLQKLKMCDIVLMSNISDYIKDLYPSQLNYVEEYIKEINKNLKTQNNNIVCAYLYDIQNTQYRSQIDNPITRKKVFEKLQITYVERKFKSVMDNCIDSIIVF